MWMSEQAQAAQESRRTEMLAIVSKCRSYLEANGVTVGEMETLGLTPQFKVVFRGVETRICGEVRRDAVLQLVVGNYGDKKKFMQTEKRKLTERFPEVVLAVEAFVEGVLMQRARSKKERERGEFCVAATKGIHETLGLEKYNREVACTGRDKQGDPCFEICLKGLTAHQVQVIFAIVKGGAQ